MSWTNYPLAPSAGFRIDSSPIGAMAAEIETAINERRLKCGVSGDVSYTELESGKRFPVDLWVGLYTKIEALVDTELWFWLNDYTGPDDYEIWKLVTTATDLDAEPPEKNIFELVFGEGVSDWPITTMLASGKRAEADEVAGILDDAAEVIDKLWWTLVEVVGVDEYEVHKSKTGDAEADAADALTSCDDASYTDPHTGLWGGAYSKVLVDLNYHLGGVWVADLKFGANVYKWTLPWATQKILFMVGVRGWEYRYTTTFQTRALGRALPGQVRIGTASYPTTYSAAKTWGTQLGTVTVPSGVWPSVFTNHLLLDSTPRSAGTLRVVVCGPASEYTAEDCNLADWQSGAIRLEEIMRNQITAQWFDAGGSDVGMLFLHDFAKGVVPT